MAKTFSREDLIDAIHKGIEKAYRSYDNGACDWLDTAPEYFVTTHIYESLRTHKKFKEKKRDGYRNYVSLEPGIQKTLNSAKAITRGRKAHILSGMKRFDLLVWNQNDTPRVVIEVKSPVFDLNSKLSKDVDRLKGALLKKAEGSSLQYAVLAMYMSVPVPDKKHTRPRDWLKAKLTQFDEGFVASHGSDRIKISFHHGATHEIKDDGAWVACCVLVERKKSS